MEVDYVDYVRENRARFTIRILKSGDLRRAPSRRMRDEEEERLLAHLDRARWRRSAEEGRVVYVGERTYRIRVGD